MESSMKKHIFIVLSFVFVTSCLANSYGIKLSDKEKLTALTNYFIEVDSQAQELSLPLKPQKPVISEPKQLIKSKYEKKKTFEQRVKIEEQSYAKRVQSIEKDYQKNLQEYEIQVKKITQNYNNQNDSRQKKIKHQSIQKAYVTVYGNPHIAQSSLEYDAEAEIFNAKLKSTKGNFTKDIVIDVPINEAEEFEKNMRYMKIKIVFELEDSAENIKYIGIKSPKNSYKAKLK